MRAPDNPLCRDKKLISPDTYTYFILISFPILFF